MGGDALVQDLVPDDERHECTADAELDGKFVHRRPTTGAIN
jgi:hypothetical protein